MIAEMNAIRDIMEAALPRGRAPQEYLVEYAVIIVIETRRRGLDKILFAGDNASALNQASLTATPVLQLAGSWLQPFYLKAKEEGILRTWVGPNELQEWISRVILSLLTLPGKNLGSAERLRSFFREVMLPSIVLDQATNKADT